MNNQYFKALAAAVRLLEGRPCQWEGCGQPSNHYTLQGGQLLPLCQLHAGTAERLGFDVRHIFPKK